MLPISIIGQARAHDYQHPELSNWYESLHSGKGPCCDGSDAKRVDLRFPHDGVDMPAF